MGDSGDEVMYGLRHDAGHSWLCSGSTRSMRQGHGLPSRLNLCHPDTTKSQHSNKSEPKDIERWYLFRAKFPHNHECLGKGHCQLTKLI
eukprot:1291327-Amphidinium_carterae.1